jgi:hypothetical protein
MQHCYMQFLTCYFILTFYLYFKLSIFKNSCEVVSIIVAYLLKYGMTYTTSCIHLTNLWIH